MNSTISPRPHQQGPMLGGVRRKHRGPLFWLFFAGGYSIFWPPPATAGHAVSVAYYLRVIAWTVQRAHRPRYSGWLLRWALVTSMLAYLVVVAAAVLWSGFGLVTGWAK